VGGGPVWAAIDTLGRHGVAHQQQLKERVNMNRLSWALCAALAMSIACEEEEPPTVMHDSGTRPKGCERYLPVAAASEALGVDDLSEGEAMPDGAAIVCDYGGAVHLVARYDSAILTLADFEADEDGGEDERMEIEGLGDTAYSVVNDGRRVTRVLVEGTPALEVASDGASAEAHEILLRLLLKNLFGIESDAGST
jgi:hypothetical protein